MNSLERLLDIRNRCEWFRYTSPDDFVFHSKFTWDEFKSKNRKGDIMYDRHILMVLLYNKTLNLSTVANRMKRNHASVINSVESIYLSLGCDFDRLNKRIMEHVDKSDELGNTPALSISGISLSNKAYKIKTITYEPY